jgi:hypothetical protein
VGEGYPGIERVSSPYVRGVDIDMIVFPDIGFAPMQRHFLNHGLPVFGAGEADELEMYRGKFLKEIEQLDLPTPNCEVVDGISGLRVYLKDRTDLYIKISKWRGDMESWHWRSWAEDEGKLDALAFRLGPAKDHLTFFVFDPIEAEIEDGIETFCVDGKMPKTCIHGMECKDAGYLGTFALMNDLPEPVRKVSEAFAPVLGKYGYRSFFSTEVRISKDGTPYFIDPTLRAGSPPSQVQCEMIANYSEVIWGAANGEVVEPEPEAEFGVQVVVKADSKLDEWTEIVLPDHLWRWVKAGQSFRIGNKLCLPPGMAAESNIWLTAIGDTIKEAIENLKSYSGDLPEGVKCDVTPLGDLLREVNEAEKSGMTFTDQPVPGPETVVEGNT